MFRFVSTLPDETRQSVVRAKSRAQGLDHHIAHQVLSHIKKLNDGLGHFLVRITCKCGASRGAEPEALARLSADRPQRARPWGSACGAPIAAQKARKSSQSPFRGFAGGGFARR